MLKRIFDFVFSLVLLILLSPLLAIISILILIDSRGGIFFVQQRVGKNNIDFQIYKFRTMYPGSEKKGQLTVGINDDRVTGVGKFLRRYKLDELPQLFNVFLGTMSFVGPRPEVRKYVNLYSSEQLKVLFVKPGITDFASIEYANENELLAQSSNPEKEYIEKIMPAKLEMNLRYLKEQIFFTDIKIIFKTIQKVFSSTR